MTKGGRKSRANQDKVLAVIGAKDRKPRDTCQNYNEKGHYRTRYSKPSKNEKEKNNKRFFKKENNSANAIDFDLKASGVYVVTYNSDNSNSEDNSMYPQESICNNDDWFSEVAEDNNWLLNTEDEVVKTAIAVTSNEAEPVSYIKLYNSGCSIHITPYYECLENYSEITPKTMNTANKQNFYAVGKGDITIEVPNSTKTSKLKLTKVLYSSKVDYTLVSIGKLDKYGFQCSFGNGKCSIFIKKGDKIGKIPKNACGLYKYTSEPPTANTVEQVTLQQLH